ncbi:MAG: hypothetical protein ABFD96_13900 [Armatimonadia bacterium]
MRTLRYAWPLLALLAALAIAGASPYTHGAGGSVGYSGHPVLPDTTLVAKHRELNFWFDAMAPQMPGQAAQGWLAYADSGRALDRSWRWTPVAAKTQTLTIKPVDANGVVGAASSMIVKAIAEDAGAVSDNILFIGDSLLKHSAADSATAASSATTDPVTLAAVDSLFEADTAAGALTFIGSLGHTYKGEGRSGYTTSRFVNSYDNNGHYFNPFWDRTNGRVSFRYYLDDQGFTGPIGYAVIMLGWNNVAGWGAADATAAQIAASISDLDTLVSVLKDPTGYRGYADCRVYVCTNPMAANALSAFGTAYAGSAAATYKAAWPYWQRNMARLNQAIIDRFDDDGTYSDPRGQVDVIPVHLWVDRIYGYPYSALAVSARNSAEILQHTNYLHPNATGKYQEADAIYSALRHGFAMPNPINLLPESERFGTWSLTGAGAAWVGWVACTVTDVDSAQGQAWSFADNTATYFAQNLSGITVQEANTISCYFQRVTTGTTYYCRYYVDLASGTDIRMAFRFSDSSPYGVLSGWEAAFTGGSTYSGTANADSSYRWHRCTNTPSGWSRVSFSFNDYAINGGSINGTAINAIRIEINTQTSDRTGLTMRLTGAQLEQGVRRPSVYVPKP